MGRNEIPSRAYVSAFGFKGPDQQKPAGVLSGGERDRLDLSVTVEDKQKDRVTSRPTTSTWRHWSSLENALKNSPDARWGTPPTAEFSTTPARTSCWPGGRERSDTGSESTTRPSGSGSRATWVPTKKKTRWKQLGMRNLGPARG